MKLRKRYPRYDAVLNTDHCSARNDAELRLTLRMGFRQINPAGDAATGTYNDYGAPDGTPRQIIRWTDADWAAWKTNFCRSAQSFWDGKFWLINRKGAFPFPQHREVYIPDIACRFELIGGNASSGFHHHIIDVVRLAASEAWFGSHSTLYDSKDTDLVQKDTDSNGNPIMQRAHVHEIGHLLGLGHVAIGQPACPANGNTNASACYGVTDADKNSVMGEGMRLDPVHAAAWLAVFDDLASTQPVSSIFAPSLSEVAPVTVSMSRTYPRTVAEFRAGTVLTTLPPGR